MRFTFVITNAPPLMGGLEKVCLRLAQQFQRLGHEVQIAGRFMRGRRPSMQDLFRESEPEGAIDCEGVTVRALTLGLRAKLLLAPVFKLIWRPATFPLARLLYTNAMRQALNSACAGSDVVHYFGVGREMLGFAAAEAARATGAAFCIDPAVHPGQWGSFWIDAKLFRSADRMFCYSAVERGALEGMGVNAKRITRVPCGFDFNDSGNGAEFRGRHALTGPVVLFLGRKTKAKGVERLLEAWPEVVARFPEATLVFAGPGGGKAGVLEKLKRGELKGEKGDRKVEIGDRGEMADGGWQVAGKKVELAVGSGQWAEGRGEKLRAESGAGRILDLDDLTEEEKQDALAACDVLCVPSEGESFGMVYFEAWAYGKPVVALDLPVLRETIGASDAGLLVREEPKEIAQGINRLLGDAELRSRLGANGRQLAIRHKWDEAAKHYLRGYAEAMQTKIL